MKKITLFLLAVLLAVLASACFPFPTTVTVTTTTTASPPPATTPPPTTTPAPTTTTSTPTTTVPTTTAIHPTTANPPTTTATPTTTVPVYGAISKKYDVTQRLSFYNEGPGSLSKLEVRVALITSTDPYQSVKSMVTYPANYTKSTDAYGNTFAEFTLEGIAPGSEVVVQIEYSLTAYEIIYEPSTGSTIPNTCLDPEPYIESDAPEIVALAAQITAGETTLRDKAWAVYNWVGDNIDYLGYQGDMMGALSCLHNYGGDCTEFACLTAALCRAAGIPARFVEGVTYIGGSDETPKHDWTEIYLPGSGWIPVDATWGRFPGNRDIYFGGTSPDHMKVSTGNPVDLGKWANEFYYLEYQWWYQNGEADVSLDEDWYLTCLSKPDTLLCTDAEYQQLVDAYAGWGWDFNAGYEEYSRMGFENGWTNFWIGSEDDESRRLYFDREGDMWKPRYIPGL